MQDLKFGGGKAGEGDLEESSCPRGALSAHLPEHQPTACWASRPWFQNCASVHAPLPCTIIWKLWTSIWYKSPWIAVVVVNNPLPHLVWSKPSGLIQFPCLLHPQHFVLSWCSTDTHVHGKGDLLALILSNGWQILFDISNRKPNQTKPLRIGGMRHFEKGHHLV